MIYLLLVLLLSFELFLGKRKFHYKFPDGGEMAEEYSMETNVLVRRAWKKKNPIRGAGEWEVEIGDPEPQFGAADDIGIKENSSAVSWLT